jgi:hypothetical protein
LELPSGTVIESSAPLRFAVEVASGAMAMRP